MFFRGTTRIKRPDWYHTIVSTAHANLMRRIARAHARTGEWPALINTDCVWYTAETENVSDLGLFYTRDQARKEKLLAPVFPKGEKLGEFRHEKTLTMDEFRAKMDSEVR